MSEPVAGWYPDPAGSGGRRYWNGAGWTEHVAPAVPRQAEPAPPPLPPVMSAPPPVGYGQEASPWGMAATPVSAAPVMAPAKAGPDGQELSGWWRRFFGYMIDGLLVSLATLLGLWVVGAATGAFDDIANSPAWVQLMDRVESDPGYVPTNEEVLDLIAPLAGVFVWGMGLSLLFSFLNGVLLVARSGQTISDRMLSNRKVVAGRRPPGVGPAFVRWIIPGLLSLVSWVVPLVGLIPWVVDYLWPLWDPRKQTWHDKAAGTYVERSDLAGPVAP